MYCPKLDLVAERRRSAMGIDVVYLRRRDACPLDRRVHATQGAVAILGGRGDVIGISREPVPDDLGINLGSSALGVLVGLEHDDAGALTHDKAVAIAVVGSRGALRRVIE